MFFLIFVANVLGGCTQSKLKAGENLFHVIQKGISGELTELQALDFVQKPLVGAIEFLAKCREISTCFHQDDPLNDVYNWLLILKNPRGRVEFHEDFLSKFTRDKDTRQNDWQPHLSSLLFKHKALNVLKVPLESLPRKNNFPEIIDVLLDYIQKHGNVQGIYRVPGSVEKADRVLEKLISGQEITEGPQAATTALKKILGQLPDSIFGFEKVLDRCCRF